MPPPSGGTLPAVAVLLALPAAAHDLQWITTDRDSAPAEFQPLATYNSVLEQVPNTAEQIGTGHYRAYLPISSAEDPRPGYDGAFGNVQVNGHGSATCKVAGWWAEDRTRAGRPTHNVVDVRCFDLDGVPVDGTFSALYLRLSDQEAAVSGEAAYLWAHNAMSLQYIPSATYQYNSAGSSNTIARLGTGEYAVSLPGLTAPGASPIVTAYGTGSERCKIRSWAHDDAGTAVYVGCSTADGAPVNTRFSLWYGDGAIGGSPKGSLSRSDVGVYTVTIDGVRSAVAIATAIGSGATRCSVFRTGSADGRLEDDVHCRGATGFPADARFTLEVLVSPS